MCPRLPGSPAPATAGALTAITRQTLRQARARGQRAHGLPDCRPQKCSPAGLFLPPPRSVSFPSSLCNFRAQPLYFPQFAHDATHTLQTTLYQSFSTFLNSPQLYCHCSLAGAHRDAPSLSAGMNTKQRRSCLRAGAPFCFDRVNAGALPASGGEGPA